MGNFEKDREVEDKLEEFKATADKISRILRMLLLTKLADKLMFQTGYLIGWVKDDLANHN